MEEIIFHRLPLWLQNILVSIKGYSLKQLRYGGDFYKQYDRFIERTDWNRERMREYQELCLSEFLKSARRSPFWKKRFKEFNVNINSSDSVYEIQKLPILTKDEVKKYSSQIRNNIISEKKVLLSRTSGSTGNALDYYEDRYALQQRWMAFWRFRSWHGISINSWSGIFGGKQIVSVNTERKPYHRVNYPGRQIRFSVYHLKSSNVKEYHKILNKRNIKWLAGYTSAITLLSSLMIDKDLPPVDTIHVVTTGSESLLPNQKSIIEKAFKVPVRQHYGLIESVANISECEKGRMHVDEDFALVEFVPFKDDSSYYKIIGTNWTNPVYPLIRYDTGDIARLSNIECLCGKIGRIVESIDGRIEDYVMLPNGSRIGRLSHIFKNTPSIREAQIYQPDINNIILRVVKGNDYDSNGEETILLSEAKKWLGNELKIQISYMNNIPKTKQGKLRLVISDIKE